MQSDVSAYEMKSKRNKSAVKGVDAGIYPVLVVKGTCGDDM